MEKEELRIDSPVSIDGIILIPIVKVVQYCWQIEDSVSGWGSKQPVSIIVVSGEDTRAFRINGEEVSLEEMEFEVAGLSDVLKVYISSER